MNGLLHLWNTKKCLFCGTNRNVTDIHFVLRSNLTSSSEISGNYNQYVATLGNETRKENDGVIYSTGIISLGSILHQHLKLNLIRKGPSRATEVMILYIAY